MGQDEQRLHEFLVGSKGPLYRTAFLLCGNPQDAEDLVQSTLVRIILAWRRLERIDHLDAYARQTLVNHFIGSRRRFWRRESPFGELPESAVPEADRELAMMLRDALATLSVKQRTVLVLRYWDDLSVEATAQVLGMRVGTVKSHSSRGIAALRAVLPAGVADATGAWEGERV